jgi:hypothetical protein
VSEGQGPGRKTGEEKKKGSDRDQQDKRLAKCGRSLAELKLLLRRHFGSWIKETLPLTADSILRSNPLLSSLFPGISSPSTLILLFLVLTNIHHCRPMVWPLPPPFFHTVAICTTRACGPAWESGFRSPESSSPRYVSKPGRRSLAYLLTLPPHQSSCF